VSHAATLRRWVRSVLVVVVLGAVVLLLVRERYGGRFAPGAASPAFAADLSDGSRLDLTEPSGQVLVLNFWASWCAPCKQEAPDLSRVHRELVQGGRGRVVGLAVEAVALDEAARTARGFGMVFPVAVADPAWAEAYGVRVLPTTFVIAPDGTVARTFVGAVRAEELLRASLAAAREAPEQR
jgi:thiol-disulfide isomerase/thioredoxin